MARSDQVTRGRSPMTFARPQSNTLSEPTKPWPSASRTRSGLQHRRGRNQDLACQSCPNGSRCDRTRTISAHHTPVPTSTDPLVTARARYWQVVDWSMSWLFATSRGDRAGRRRGRRAWGTGSARAWTSWRWLRPAALGSALQVQLVVLGANIGGPTRQGTGRLDVGRGPDARR